MTYDIIISDLERAKEAIGSGNIEKRTAEIRHALMALEHLQGSLNFAEGGDCAKNLDSLYSLLRGKLLEAQIKVSAELLDQQISLLLSVRDAWQQVEQMTGAQQAPPPEMFVPAAAMAESEMISTAQWSA